MLTGLSGLPNLFSQGETAMKSLRCGSIRQVTFVKTKRSFVATKVQLAWKILQRSSMSPEVHSDTKITVQTSFPTKCTTEIFQRNFILTEMSETGYSWKLGGAFSATEEPRNCGSLSMASEIPSSQNMPCGTVHVNLCMGHSTPHAGKCGKHG